MTLMPLPTATNIIPGLSLEAFADGGTQIHSGQTNADHFVRQLRGDFGIHAGCRIQCLKELLQWNPFG
jgi:hypothetical protein